MKDYYLWFLILFVAISACVVSYKKGYDDGYKLGITLCPAIMHSDPHDQNALDRPQSQITPQAGE